MNVDQLHASLQAAGVDFRYLSICNVPPEPAGRHFLVFHNGVWETFFWEGRKKEERQTFTSEEAACQHFLKWVSSKADLRIGR